MDVNGITNLCSNFNILDIFCDIGCFFNDCIMNFGLGVWDTALTEEESGLDRLTIMRNLPASFFLLDLLD